MNGGCTLVLVFLVDVYLVFLGLQSAVNECGGIGVALAAAAALTGFAALVALKGEAR